MKTETEVIETTTELAKLVKINTEFIRILLVTIDNGIVSEQKELIGAVDNLKTIVKEADYKKVETAIISEFQKLIDDNSELNINIDSFLYHAQAKRDKATFALTKKEELNTSSRRFILESFNDVANPIREHQEEQRQLEVERVAREKELQEIEKAKEFQTKNLNMLVKAITTLDKTSKEVVKKGILDLQDIDCSMYPSIDCSLIVGRAVANLNDIISTIEQIELKQEQEKIELGEYRKREEEALAKKIALEKEEIETIGKVQALTNCDLPLNELEKNLEAVRKLYNKEYSISTKEIIRNIGELIKTAIATDRKSLHENEMRMVLKQVRFIDENTNMLDISSVRDGIQKTKKIETNNLEFAREDALNAINDMINVLT